MKQLLILILLCTTMAAKSQEIEKFTRKCNAMKISQNDKWGKASGEKTTFLLNCNHYGDIIFINGDLEMLLYHKVGKVETGETTDGHAYQVMRCRDRDGDILIFQVFDEPEDGIRITYQKLKLVMYFYTDKKFDLNNDE